MLPSQSVRRVKTPFGQENRISIDDSVQLSPTFFRLRKQMIDAVPAPGFKARLTAHFLDGVCLGPGRKGEDPDAGA